MRRQLLLEMQERFNQAFREAATRSMVQYADPTISPPVDVSRGNGAYYIRMDLPGVKREEVRVEAEEGIIRINGIKPFVINETERQVRGERQFGRFTVVVPLPADADTGDVKARLTEGILQVQVGFRQSQGKHLIEINVE